MQYPTPTEQKPLTEQQQIIKLLEEQNGYLKYLYQEKKQSNQQALYTNIARIILQLLPFIICLLILGYLYFLVESYLVSLNDSVKNLNQAYLDFSTQVEKFLPSLQSLQEAIKNLSDGLKNLVGNFNIFGR